MRVRLFRLLRIVSVSLRFGLHELALDHQSARGVRKLLPPFLLRRRYKAPRAVRLRRALEALGPIFVKFGQLLSTRRDLLPTDIADELAKLQDRVPAFPVEDVLERRDHLLDREGRYTVLELRELVRDIGRQQVATRR